MDAVLGCGPRRGRNALAAVRPPEVLAFHLGDAAGGAHRVTWDGEALRYERFREDFEKLRESRARPDAAAWTAFARALERVAPEGWDPRYDGPEGGDRWTLELVWDARTVRASGDGAYPPDFVRFKLAIWALLGNPPAI